MKPDRCLNGDYLFKEKAAAPTAAVVTSGMSEIRFLERLRLPAHGALNTPCCLGWTQQPPAVHAQP